VIVFVFVVGNLGIIMIIMIIMNLMAVVGMEHAACLVSMCIRHVQNMCRIVHEHEASVHQHDIPVVKSSDDPQIAHRTLSLKDDLVA
jgi:hypothetical protein